jgi:hypothetical protein
MLRRAVRHVIADVGAASRHARLQHRYENPRYSNIFLILHSPSVLQTAQSNSFHRSDKRLHQMNVYNLHAWPMKMGTTARSETSVRNYHSTPHKILPQLPHLSKGYRQTAAQLTAWRSTSNSGKAISLQAWTGPEGCRRLRLPDFKTIGTWRW